MGYLATACEFFVGTVFAAAAAAKTGRGRFRPFAREVARLGLIPRRLVGPTSLAVVAGEAAAAVALVAAAVIRLLRLGEPAAQAAAVAGLAVALLLLTGFTTAVAVSLVRGVQAACRCFGGSGSALSWRHVARNLVIAALAGVGLAAETTPDAGLAPAGGLVIAALCGVLAGALVSYLDEIHDLLAA